MLKKPKIVHGSVGNYRVEEVLDTDGEVIGYVVLDPNGNVLEGFGDIDEAIASLEKRLVELAIPKLREQSMQEPKPKLDPPPEPDVFIPEPPSGPG